MVGWLGAQTRRRWFVALAVTLAIGLVAGGVSIAAGRDKGGIDKKQFLTFVDITIDEAFVDEPPKATGEEASPGDTFFFRDALWNRAETKKKGELQGQCAFLFNLRAHCEATVYLSGGTVQLEGGVSFAGEQGPGSFFVAVIGGTQKYKNAVGQATIIEGDGPKGLLKLELLPAGEDDNGNDRQAR